MKSNRKLHRLTLGKFIGCVYDACDERKAEGMVRFAIKAHLIEFRGKQRFAII